MTLDELEPEFYARLDDRTRQQVATIAEAHGVDFLCPKCFEANNGAMGTHHVFCWFSGRGVPDSETPGPGRWAVSGTSLADLTLSPSVFLQSGCCWHGWVRAGEVTSC